MTGRERGEEGERGVQNVDKKRGAEGAEGKGGRVRVQVWRETLRGSRQTSICKLQGLLRFLQRLRFGLHVCEGR